MANVRHERCDHSGCINIPSFGKAGGEVELCAEHAEEDRMNICERRCGHSGCIKQASFGEAGGKVGSSSLNTPNPGWPTYS